MNNDLKNTTVSIYMTPSMLSSNLKTISVLDAIDADSINSDSEFGDLIIHNTSTNTNIQINVPLSLYLKIIVYQQR